MVYYNHRQISTHTLTWSVTGHISIATGDGNTFQLTRSRGAWHAKMIMWRPQERISTHTLTWSVTRHRGIQWRQSNISTHTLTWSVTYHHLCQQATPTFQLTRSRGAWLKEVFKWLTLKTISTHTLTWSVTSILGEPSAGERFQLTRSRGAWQGGF